jgi:glycosyltransferase involved in cell wall biosynthesis
MANFQCIICSCPEQNYLFTSSDGRIYRCSGCGLVRSRQGTSEMMVPASALEDAPARGDLQSELEAAKNYAAILAEHRLLEGRVLLVTDWLEHPLAELLKERGFGVCVRQPGEMRLMRSANYDCAIFIHCLQQSINPTDLLDSGRAILKDGGLLLIHLSSLESCSTRAFRRSLEAWHPRNRFYFSRTTLQLLLEKSGFNSIWMHSKPAAGTKGVAGVVASCRKVAQRRGPVLSIVMPAYNERATIVKTLDAVLAKKVEGIAQKEIILVESNSTDGTRDIVRSYEGTPGLKIVYEERPQGKGHAVRTGFEHATGDVVLIQDADCEYDINDYDELLKPLLDNQALFVLGSRHQGNWKMRSFTDKPLLALLFNFGHVLFTTLMNVLYGQRMNDPFTMYKVMRRECLYGLKFECNRFDFDHELVIKLLLKGYTPLEIPVNYWSRDYSEGKKVTVVMDPLLWIKANFKYRFVSPFKPLSALVQERRSAEAVRKEVALAGAAHDA